MRATSKRRLVALEAKLGDANAQLVTKLQERIFSSFTRQEQYAWDAYMVNKERPGYRPTPREQELALKWEAALADPSLQPLLRCHSRQQWAIQWGKALRGDE